LGDALREALRDVGDGELRRRCLEREVGRVGARSDVVTVDGLELCMSASRATWVCVYSPCDTGCVDDGALVHAAQAFARWKLPGLYLPAHLDVVTF
jgi:hypothetical protein